MTHAGQVRRLVGSMHHVHVDSVIVAGVGPVANCQVKTFIESRDPTRAETPGLSSSGRIDHDGKYRHRVRHGCCTLTERPVRTLVGVDDAAIEHSRRWRSRGLSAAPDGAVSCLVMLPDVCADNVVPVVTLGGDTLGSRRGGRMSQGPAKMGS